MLRHDALKDLIRNRRQVVGGKARRRLKKPPRPLSQMRYQIAYRKFLQEVIEHFISLTNRTLIPKLSTMFAQARINHPARFDDFDDELDDALDAIDLEFAAEYAEDRLKKRVALFADGVSDLNRKSNQKIVKRVLGVDVFYDEPYLEEFLSSFAAANAGLIQKMADDQLDRISQMVFEAFRSGTRWEDLSDDIQDRFGVMDTAANRIARDQISKLSAGLDRLRQQELGVGRYVWRGVGDNRERDSHLENNDQIFSWDEPPEETGHPGEDINCRCYAEPVLDDVLEQQDSDQETE